MGYTSAIGEGGVACYFTATVSTAEVATRAWGTAATVAADDLVGSKNKVQIHLEGLRH